MNIIEHFLFRNSIFKTSKFLAPISQSTQAKRYYPEVRKRFYKNVTVAQNEKEFEVNLDHRKLKTSAGKVLKVPSYPLALGVASEWMGVQEKIVPTWMHLTGLCFTVMDNPQRLTKENKALKAMEYFDTDTLLFREEHKEDFFQLQKQEWGPVLEWFNHRFDVNISANSGICASEISQEDRKKIMNYFISYNTWAVSGILYAVEAIKSILLTTACLERKITPEKAVTLSLLETQFQTDHWGRVEWSHDSEQEGTVARFSAAVLFVHLNSKHYEKKQKISI